MFESAKALSLNSHELVISIQSAENPAKALRDLQNLFNEKQIAFPQMLQCSLENGQTEILLTGPQEIIVAVKRELKAHSQFKVQDHEYSTVTLTCTGATSPDLVQQVLDLLTTKNLPTEKIMMSAMSLTVMTTLSARKNVIETLHSLIEA